MVRVLQRYMITCMLFVTMVILSSGFLTHYENGAQVFLILMLSVIAFSVILETWLARTELSSRKVRFIQTLAFPGAIIIIGFVCIYLFPMV
ncbi:MULTISPECIES: hypothetical protein [unclassified Staphylococcus]|uniref:hypothetical protein n=1 Tax=unclassified Staphylococcus TaxID=91994 RepID=UPI0021CF50EC|nr:MULTISPECIES: hypothetical protein [unclassified Staphylococcus]UXR69327.1 hypothetical protein MUA26_09400 [Staphylococcus sp. IVB6246]UXR71380.1 hypothetical protein MUA88_09420 [Staphylococcus sp. IVB6240]UXR73658.1 hypothetical protein MUA48_09920 [Staphylococcus sp. IVB6238]UXR75975.1 hypothetical protein MUA74_10005 [Staphylococcus sp. IVB6233]UXR80172.1 hypothetical protein MUA65_09610 [Staphylococcus sp. IVB6218]